MATMKELVPAEFHDRGYLKGILDLEQGPEAYGQVFKKLDGAESLLGKRPALPGTDAKEEDLDKFYGQFRPAKAEDYEIPVGDPTKADAPFLQLVKNAFHAGNISAHQAKRFFAAFNPQIQARALEQQKVAAAAKQKADADFDTLAKGMLGEAHKEEIALARRMIEENCPAPMREYMGRMKDEDMVLLTGVLNGMAKKYIPEDKLNPKGAKGGASPDKSSRDKAFELMGSPAYKDQFHPEHDKVRKEVDRLYQESAVPA